MGTAFGLFGPLSGVRPPISRRLRARLLSAAALTWKRMAAPEGSCAVTRSCRITGAWSRWKELDTSQRSNESIPGRVSVFCFLCVCVCFFFFFKSTCFFVFFFCSGRFCCSLLSNKHAQSTRTPVFGPCFVEGFFDVVLSFLFSHAQSTGEPFCFAFFKRG